MSTKPLTKIIGPIHSQLICNYDLILRGPSESEKISLIETCCRYTHDVITPNIYPNYKIVRPKLFGFEHETKIQLSFYGGSTRVLKDHTLQLIRC